MWRIEAFGTLSGGPSHQGKCPSLLLLVCPFSCRVLPSQLWVIEGKGIMFHKLIMYPENLWSTLDPRCPELFAESPLLGCRPLLLLCQPQLCCTDGEALLLFPVFPQWQLFFHCVTFLFPSDSSCPFAPVSGGPCHFKQNNLFPQLWQTWVIPQRHSIMQLSELW